MSDSSESSAQEGRRWLLLIHQLPPKPDYLRVKVRRRLHRLGAVALKASVYVLPETDEHLEDFQWLANEIMSDGGDATICSATFLSGVSDMDLEPQFATPRAERRDTEHPPRNATWVTRRGVFVDRIASAWLIRRFIDPGAQFKFVAARGYAPAPGELRFDMFEGEFTHEGERCTFETLAARFGISDAAVAAIGEIVHDIDCKDARFERAETPGILAVLEGIRGTVKDDAERLRQGAVVFEGLYRRLGGSAAV